METSQTTDQAGERTQTPDERNDAIRAQIDVDMPRPVGGFESADAEDEFRANHDAEFAKRTQWQARYSAAWDRLFAALTEEQRANIIAAPSGEQSAQLGAASWAAADAETP